MIINQRMAPVNNPIITISLFLIFREKFDKLEERPSLADPISVKAEVPEDISAFFGHPLTAASSALTGDNGDNQASALALLHEYQNLPAIDRSDMKIGDKFQSLNDLLRLDD